VHTEEVDVAFGPLRTADLPQLATWLGRPHVRRWWREPADLASVEKRYLPLVERSDRTEGFVVRLDGRPVGYVQRYLVDDDAGWRDTMEAALGDVGGIGIDYLLGEADVVGRGVGHLMIARFVDECWHRYPEERRIVAAVQQQNVASWRALESVGFRRVWEGNLESSDPSDEGPSFIYRVFRGRPE
jgi:aminoglycoside 6'-N-acetyltransferase